MGTKLLLLDSLLQEDPPAPPPTPPCPRKLTSSTPSPTLPSSSSRRPLASWTPTRTDSCPPPTSSLPSAPTARTSVVERLRLCLTRSTDQWTSPRWSPSSPPRWPVDPTMMTSSLPPSRPSRWTARLCRRLQALPHDLRCQVLRQRSRRRLRGDEDRRGHDRVKVNIFGCLLIKASRTELPGRHIRKKNHQLISCYWTCPSVETHIHSVKNHHRHHQSEILHWDQ